MRPYYKNILKDICRNTLGSAVCTLTGKPLKFVIFSNGRAGSNLLVSILKKHPNVRVHSEIFGEYQLEDPLVRRKINVHGSALYMRNCFRPLAFEKAVGLKTLYYQLDKRYGYVRGIPDVINARNELLKDESIFYIHLKRRDLLATIVSKHLALSSRSWLSKPYGIQTVNIEPEVAEKEFLEFEQAARHFDDLLPKARTLEIYYEDLIGNLAGHLRTIFRFINVPVVTTEIPLRKQTTKPHCEYIANLDELMRYFDGSRYEKYFAGATLGEEVTQRC